MQRLSSGPTQAGITVKKNQDFSEWYTQVVTKADLVDYAPVKGFVALKPAGYAIWESIRSLLDSKLKETGHQNAFLPVLIPESLLSREAAHFAGFTPEVFWVTRAGDNELAEKLALRPTSETLAYSMFANWISSYRELPLKVNFWNSALRAEIKSTKPFVRTSEFLWQEGHTVHATEAEAKEEVSSILAMYKQLIEEKLAIPVVAGHKSEREKFVGADYTTTVEGLMPDGKALQMGTSHHLGQNFSKPFDIKFIGEDTLEHFAWQTSWGVSWRLIGALVMVHGDDKGLVFPPEVAPVQVVIVPIHRDADSEMVKQHAHALGKELKAAGIRCYVDDRNQHTSAWKFNEWEMRGIPLRINIGPRDIKNGQVEMARRDSGEKFSKARQEAVSSVAHILADIQTALFSRAQDAMNKKSYRIENYEQLKSRIEFGGFFYAGWCERSECEEKIKQETGADIRVLPFNQDSMPETCIRCGESSKKLAVFARAY